MAEMGLFFILMHSMYQLVIKKEKMTYLPAVVRKTLIIAAMVCYVSFIDKLGLVKNRL